MSFGCEFHGWYYEDPCPGCEKMDADKARLSRYETAMRNVLRLLDNEMNHETSVVSVNGYPSEEHVESLCLLCKLNKILRSALSES